MRDNVFDFRVVFGVQKTFFFGKGNNSMIMVTVLLSMALAVGYSVHYINSFKMHFRKSGKRKDSIVMGVRDSGWALFFTVITTMAGMLSFLAAGIRPMR